MVINSHSKLGRKMVEVYFPTLKIRKPKLKMRSSWIREDSNSMTCVLIRKGKLGHRDMPRKSTVR